ncbi:extracellular solute-binding protein [Ruminococcus sp.]|uniref:extracellular solute-binding protein n=1 Tax=Ruminococcus sp. TaxID=41978 RepID=UPI002E821829|nr:extracellular solute-binding protein [Ruminococcus sp.]MEE3439722.1 extracellular solute-binding protein [Ruminococcus sp.]
MKIKRILSLVLAAAMMAVVFVGCSKSEDKTSSTGGAAKTVEVEKNAKLKLWGPAASLSILKEQAKAFEKKYADKNVKIEVVAQEESDAGTQVLNDSEAAADVFAFPSDQITKLTQAKALLPVNNNYVDDIKKNHTAAAVDTVKGDLNGKEVLYAFPETDNGYYLVYDKSVISDEDAKSWEGILAACKKNGRQFIMDAGNGYYSCMFPFTGGLKLDGLEGDAQDTQKFNKYDEDEVAQTMSAFSELFHKYKDTFVSATVDKVSAGFSTAKRTCGAGIDGTWNAAVNKEALGKDFGVTVLPTINVNGKDKKTVAMIGYKYIGVKSVTKFPNAAEELANYLVSAECQKTRLDKLGWTPTNKGVEVEGNDAINTMLEEAKTFVVQANIIQAFWDPMANLGNKVYKADEKSDVATMKTLLKDTLTNINS